MVQAPTEPNIKHIYQLNASDNLPSGTLSLAVDHRIDHKYPKLLNISLLSTEYDAVHVPRKTVIGKLQRSEMESIEISSVSWTNENSKTPVSPVELLTMPPESSFQLEQNGLRQWIHLQHAQIPQEAKDKLSS